jgi:hypothetical protein
MAFKISDGMSVYQLGVALNTVFPVLIGGFHSSRYHLARKIENKIRVYFPNFVINDSDDGVFIHFIARSIGGVKIANTFKPVIVLLSIISLVSSIVLMVVSTIHPLLVFRNVYLFVYVACAICIAPIMYYGWSVYLSFVIKIVSEKEIDKVDAESYCAYFDISKKLHRLQILGKKLLVLLRCLDIFVGNRIGV